MVKKAIIYRHYNKPYIKNRTNKNKYIVDIIAPNSNIIVHGLCLRNTNGNLYLVICSMHQIIPIKQYTATRIALNNRNGIQLR